MPLSDWMHSWSTKGLGSSEELGVCEVEAAFSKSC